jgi:tetratricopeptide (TPR) repeat protein
MTELAQMTSLPPPSDARPPVGRARVAARPVWISLLLAAATLLVYYTVGWFHFVNLDDPMYVSSNAHVQAGLSLKGVTWALSTGHAGNWHPLTWLSHMLDAQAFGSGPAGPHVVNLLFHVANTLLLFALLRRLTMAVWRSALVAALFALHPLHVESVAWIAERKDVLSAFFFMLTLWAYARYANDECRMTNDEGNPKAEIQNARGTVRTTDHGPRFTLHASRFYGLSLAFFALGLMSKPMLVTVPFVLLLLDYWPLGRMQKAEGASSSFILHPSSFILLEKLPFFLLCVLSCFVTFVAQKKGGAVQSLTQMPLGPRLANIPVAYARYLGKTLWPAGLATPYPRVEHLPVIQVLLAVALLAGLTLGAVWLGHRWRFVGVGWLWFVGMLVPVIGLVQVGEQPMADRYTYLPLIGLFIIVAWGAGEICERWRFSKAAFAVGAGFVLIACAVQTRHQLGCWRNSEALYRHNLAVTRNNWVACYNLGSYFDDQKCLDDALFYYHKALEMQPRYPDALNNIGVVLVARKQYAEAIPYFERSLKAAPGFYEAHNNLGRALEGLGKFDHAIQEYRLVLAKKPDDVAVLNNLGNALVRKGHVTDAIQYYEASLRAKPDDAAALFGLAGALARLGRTDEAIQHYRILVERNPDDASAHKELGLILARKGNLAEAMQEFREAVRWKPGDPDLLCDLGRTLAGQQRLDEAIPLYLEALRIAPTNANYHVALGQALAATGKLDEAVAHLQEAVRLDPGNASAHLNLGLALASQGKHGEAVQHFNEALRIRPNYAQARRALEAVTAQKPR